MRPFISMVSFADWRKIEGRIRNQQRATVVLLSTFDSRRGVSSLSRSNPLNHSFFAQYNHKTLKMSSSSSPSSTDIRTIPIGHCVADNDIQKWDACFDLINNTPTPQCTEWFDAMNENTKNIMQPWTEGKEDDNALVMKMKMPGLSKEDVRITVEKGVLTASGRVPVPGETEEDRRTKGSSGYVNQLMFRPPYFYKLNQIKAKMRNGVLKIAIPKDMKRTKKDYVDEFIKVKVI